MSVRRYMFLPILIAAIGVGYYFLSHEWIGTVLLIVFAGAMAVMGAILIPTLNDAGPTAPIDPDFEYRGR